MPRRQISQRSGFFNRTVGPLQRQLQQGEYGLFRLSPMFESDFVQISKQGGPIEIHNQEQIVTVGITSTSPVLLIPNVLLLARPIIPSEDNTPLVKPRIRHQPLVRYELTRLFPLRFVKITIHSTERQQLRFKLANGRTFYLQLCPESDRREDLFDAWVRIVQLLRPVSDVNLEEPKEKARGQKRRGKSPPLKALIPPPQHNSPPSSPVNASSWNIHTATKTASALETKVKKKKKKKSPAPSSGALDKFRDPPPPPPPPLPVPPPMPVEVPAFTSSLEVLKSAETLEDVPESSFPQKSRSQPSDKALPESSPHAKRKSNKSHSSRSRSRQRGAFRKPSKLFSFISACSWGSTKKETRTAKARGKGKKY